MTALLLTLLCAPALRQGTPAAAQPESSQAAAQPSAAEVEQRVRSYLGVIDEPVPESAWRDLGPQAAVVLDRIAHDPNELPTRRAKAVTGLSIVGSPTAPATMLELAQDEAQPLVVRLAAVSGAGRTLAPRQVASELQPVLQGASNGYVRRAAAEVIAAHGGCAAVQKQAQRAGERAWMSRALEKCGE
jgi:HEAT repeat protein